MRLARWQRARQSGRESGVQRRACGESVASSASERRDGFRLRCPVPVFIYDAIPTGTIDKIDDEPVEATRFQSDTDFKVGDVLPSTLVRPGTWTVEWLQDRGETEWAESPTPGTIQSRRLYCRVDP